MIHDSLTVVYLL